MLHRRVTAIFIGYTLVAIMSALGADLPSEYDIQAQPQSTTACDEQQVTFMIAQAGEPVDPRPPSDVQERAVPRMTPGTKPMTRLEGGVIEGSRLQANPGYVLDPLPGGRVMLRPNGGGLGVEANCRCESSGGCSVQIVGSEARCVKTEGKGCNTPCYMTVGGGKLQMR